MKRNLIIIITMIIRFIDNKHNNGFIDNIKFLIKTNNKKIDIPFYWTLLKNDREYCTNLLL